MSSVASTPPPVAQPIGPGKKPLWRGLGFQIIVAMVLGAAVGFLLPSVAVMVSG